jgi:glycerophosphoryl diester phosphodiesterase
LPIGGGSGLWPQNSRTALLNSIATAKEPDHAKRYQGIELDIALTKDAHPILSHDPWVRTELCQTATGETIGKRVLIKDLTLAELQSRFICGGLPDEDFPEVIPKAEEIATLDEVLEALKRPPDMILYLDIKIDGGLTASADAYARAHSRSLEAAHLPNPLYIEGPNAASLRAYRAGIDAEYVPVLSYPPPTARQRTIS